MTIPINWTSISNFHTIRKAQEAEPSLLNGVPEKQVYFAKVKLHGTCGIVIIEPDGKVTAMSREGDMESTKGLKGFGAWVEKNKDYFASKANPKCRVAIFGEWAGPGVQQGVALSQMKDKVFAVFAIRKVTDEDNTQYFVNPPAIRGYIEEENLPGAYVLPWFSKTEDQLPEVYEISWRDTAENLAPLLDRINEDVKAVEACDPWVKKVFGIEGTGEGLVLYPHNTRGFENFANLMFKAKGEKHQVLGGTKPVQADPTKAASAEAFATMVVTEARCLQGAAAVNNGEPGFDFKLVPSFLTWLKADIAKECQAEITAADLTEAEALKACEAAGRAWYVAKAKGG